MNTPPTREIHQVLTPETIQMLVLIAEKGSFAAAVLTDQPAAFPGGDFEV